MHKTPFKNLLVTTSNAEKKIKEIKSAQSRAKCEAFFYANIEKPEPHTSIHWSLQLKDSWEMKIVGEDNQFRYMNLIADVLIIVGFDTGEEIPMDQWEGMTIKEYLREFGHGDIKDLEMSKVIINEGVSCDLSHVWKQPVKYGMKIFIPSEKY